MMAASRFRLVRGDSVPCWPCCSFGRTSWLRATGWWTSCGESRPRRRRTRCSTTRCRACGRRLVETGGSRHTEARTGATSTPESGMSIASRSCSRAAGPRSTPIRPAWRRSFGRRSTSGAALRSPTFRMSGLPRPRSPAWRRGARREPDRALCGRAGPMRRAPGSGGASPRPPGRGGEHAGREIPHLSLPVENSVLVDRAGMAPRDRHEAHARGSFAPEPTRGRRRLAVSRRDPSVNRVRASQAFAASSSSACGGGGVNLAVARRLAPPEYSDVRPTGKFWPKVAPSLTTPTEESRRFAGTSAMELAGLEPATSWVRSRRSPN
jgi:hypothetical protein